MNWYSLILWIRNYFKIQKRFFFSLGLLFFLFSCLCFPSLLSFSFVISLRVVFTWGRRGWLATVGFLFVLSDKRIINPPPSQKTSLLKNERCSRTGQCTCQRKNRIKWYHLWENEKKQERERKWANWRWRHHQTIASISLQTSPKKRIKSEQTTKNQTNNRRRDETNRPTTATTTTTQSKRGHNRKEVQWRFVHWTVRAMILIFFSLLFLGFGFFWTNSERTTRPSFPSDRRRGSGSKKWRRGGGILRNRDNYQMIFLSCFFCVRGKERKREGERERKRVEERNRFFVLKKRNSEKKIDGPTFDIDLFRRVLSFFLVAFCGFHDGKNMICGFVCFLFFNRFCFCDRRNRQKIQKIEKITKIKSGKKERKKERKKEKEKQKRWNTMTHTYTHTYTCLVWVGFLFIDIIDIIIIIIIVISFLFLEKKNKQMKPENANEAVRKPLGSGDPAVTIEWMKPMILFYPKKLKTPACQTASQATLMIFFFCKFWTRSRKTIGQKEKREKRQRERERFC